MSAGSGPETGMPPERPVSADECAFLLDAAHELRTPLTSVLANLELLSEELSGEQAETAQAALRATQRMRRLVDDLLVLARAESRPAHTRRPIDLGEVLTEVVSELAPIAGTHELSVRAGPAVVAGAGDDLHRLILNLVENALRHTPPGTRVEARTETRDGQAVLIVRDEGPGIPPDLAARVFDRFARGASGGSGLGLAIVQAVAREHGGSVRLEGPGGGGARFVVHLPARSDGDDSVTLATGLCGGDAQLSDQ
jgi:signal transduction histidine kinase